MTDFHPERTWHRWIKIEAGAYKYGPFEVRNMVGTMARGWHIIDTRTGVHVASRPTLSTAKELVHQKAYQ